MDEVTEVKSRLEIAEVVGGYVPLKQAGRNLKAPCPFHQEKSASFMVSPDKGIYHCFGCGEGGDIFNFVMKMEGIGFREALEMLARKAGVELSARKGEDSAVKKMRARLFEAHELAVKYYQASLVQNRKALEYVVQKRKLGKETIKAFQIGYAPDSWEALTGFLLKKGFTQKELLQGGLASQKEGRSTVYDMFRGRIMFTICDREGRPVGFTGRVMDDSMPKYLNTPQTALYDKSQVIFGLHLAKEAIRMADEVVLVEGNMDVIASHQAGVKQVVAASGTALTMDQLRTLSKLTKNIKLAFDADRAGLAATERAIEMGQKLGLTLRMVVLPEGAKDADELIQQDVEAWRGAIANAKYIVDYLFNRFEADFDLNSAVGKRGYADRLASNLRRLGDPVEQDHYVKLLADKTGTSVEAVRAKIAQADAVAAEAVAGAGVLGAGSAGPDASAAGKQAAGKRAASRGTAVTAQAAPVVVAGATAQPDEQPVRRAVVQAQGKPSVRVLHEESFLALNLLYMGCRSSLDDLAPQRFSSQERKSVFEALVKYKSDPSDVIVSKTGELANYIKRLLLVGEEEFQEMSEIEIQQEAFVLAGKILKASNLEYKEKLNIAIAAAEKQGDREQWAALMQKYKAIIDSER